MSLQPNASHVTFIHHGDRHTILALRPAQQKVLLGGMVDMQRQELVYCHLDTVTRNRMPSSMLAEPRLCASGGALGLLNLDGSK